MAITNGYCTLAELRAAMREPANAALNTLLENAIEGASRRIDGYCSQVFFSTAKVITFYPQHSTRLAVPALSTVPTTVKTAPDSAGVYQTTWVNGTDYQLEPLEAGIESRPYRSIAAIGTKSFSVVDRSSRPSVQIDAVWGWAAIPDDIREACLILAHRSFKRHDSPLGVLGSSEMLITVRAVDPDVRDMLQPYRLLAFA